MIDLVGALESSASSTEKSGHVSFAQCTIIIYVTMVVLIFIAIEKFLISSIITKEDYYWYGLKMLIISIYLAHICVKHKNTQ